MFTIRSFLVSLGLFLLTVSTLGAGPVFRDGRPLLTLKTEHFTFIFPPQSQAAAELLTGEAEELYAEVAAKLGVPTNLHIPVVLTPDTDDLNGYFTSIPSIRIVLYEAPISPNSGFALFRDTLKKLFLHELVHAVSLMQTEGLGSFLVALLGDALYPAMYWTPANFVEGVTVSFESADGFGRANDAAFASVLQQAIVENRWPTFTETAGATTGYPSGSFYSWGGWFSRYLQDTYGLEKYAELFHAFGRAGGLEDFLWFQGAFRTAYGRSLAEAWEDFRLWMQPRQALRVDLKPVDDGPGYIVATAAWGEKLYWSDYRGLWTRRDGKPVLLTELGKYANRLAVSPDGRRLLISRSEADGALSTAVLTEWDLEAGRPTGKVFPAHLVEASYLGEGLVACRVHGYTMDLVALEGGVETVLLAGTERLVPAAPTAFDDGRVSFLLQRDGQQELAFVDPATRAVSIVEGAGLQGIRQISSDGQRVWFAWDNDRTFLKLGVLERDQITTYPAVSGGVQYPVAAGGKVYAVSGQAQGHRLMELPDLPATSVPVTQVPLGPDELARPSAYDRLPQQRAEAYSPWLWALVPQFRYPTFVLNPHATDLSDVANLVRGAGVGTTASDPTETLALATSAAWLWTSNFAEWNLDLTSTAGSVDWSFSAFDRLVGYPERGEDVRKTGTRVSVVDTWYGVSDTLSWMADVGALLAASGPANGAAYRFASPRVAVPFGVQAIYQNLRPVDFSGEQWGFQTQTAWNGVDLAGLGGAGLSVILPFWRTSATVSGVAVTNGALTLGTAGPLPSDGSLWLGDVPYQVSPALVRSNLASTWLVQGDVNFGFSVPIRRDLPGIGFANSLDLQSGYQGLWLDGRYLDNLYTRIALNFRSGAVPILLRAPLAVGVRLDQALAGPSAGPVLSLDVGGAFY
ncbi:MAG: hypothetical protein WCG80_08865 [Spirochaetales bacterium]